MTPAQEEKLIERLKLRDEAAFRTFVRQYQDKIYNLVFRMMGNAQEAEDVSQEVFITVFKNIDAFRGDARFSTWLYRIAINHCKNRLKYLGRRAGGRTQTLDDTPEATIGMSPLQNNLPRPDNQAIGKELEGIMQRAIAQLEEEHRVLIVLRDIENMPYNEITEITGLNPGTVKSRLHRARVALKEQVRRLYE